MGRDLPYCEDLDKFCCAVALVRVECDFGFVGSDLQCVGMANKVSLKVSAERMVGCLVACKIAASTTFERAR